MAKTTTRYVMVDMGYAPMEHWVKAKVISSSSSTNLFTGELEESLLVELPDKERVLVDFWENLETTS